MSADCCNTKTQPAHATHTHPADKSGGQGCCSGHAAPARTTLGRTVAGDDGHLTPIRIMQMDCPTEEALIRSALGGLPGVLSMEFNLLQRILTVRHDATALDSVLSGIRQLGFTPELAEDAPAKDARPEPATAWWPLALAGVLALASEVAHALEWPIWAAAGLALLAVFSCGTSTYRKGWVALRHGNLNINALMSIAVSGAFLIGQWPEAAMVMVLFTLAERIEARSLDHARQAIKELLQLAPENATVQQTDGSWRSMAATAVTTGALVRVAPGERIALDGIILTGQSTVNQAPITGESLPVDKKPGDRVFAGTINVFGAFDFTVSAAASDSTLARIIHAVEAAQGVRAPIQRFIDQFSRIYTPVIFMIALGVALLPPLLSGADWLDWVYKALVLLVIACPCALVISTPVTIVSGLAAAARHGILIKGGVFLEEGRKLGWIAFDKTGTLTHGKPQQTDFAVLSDTPEATVRRLAASLSSRSDHPVSQALAAAAVRDNVEFSAVDDFSALPGRGVKGTIAGQQYQLGNHRLIHELGLCSNELEAQLDVLERQGKSLILLVDTQQVLGLFAVADTLKESSRTAIAELHALGIRTLMLSGDNQHTAQAIATQLGIDEVHGELLPEDKLKAIESKLGAYGKVGMVGDGINDAPALARADIGFAMGAAGSGTAIETADIALMDDDLRKLPRFIQLSRDTHAILIQNITLALGIKALFLALTLSGFGTLWMAVFADMGSSLLVVANGLRMLRR